MHCLSNSWSCCRITNCKLRKLCFNNPRQSMNLARVWLWYWCEKKCEVQSLFWERELEISFSYRQIMQSYERNKKLGFIKRGRTSDARIWSFMKLKGLLMRVGNSFLFNSVHLWTVTLYFTLFRGWLHPLRFRTFLITFI